MVIYKPVASQSATGFVVYKAIKEQLINYQQLLFGCS